MRYSRTILARPPPDAANYQPPPPAGEHHAFAEALPQLFFLNAHELASAGEEISPPKIEWTEHDGTADSNSNPTTFNDDQVDVEMSAAESHANEKGNDIGADVQMTEPQAESSQPRKRRFKPIRVRVAGLPLQKKAGKARKLKKVKKIKKSRKVKDVENDLDSSLEEGFLTCYKWSNLHALHDPMSSTGQVLFDVDNHHFTIPKEPIIPNLDPRIW